MERAADTRKQLYIFNLNKKLKILKTQMEWLLRQNWGKIYGTQNRSYSIKQNVQK
jgi:hypothetical protein